MELKRVLSLEYDVPNVDIRNFIEKNSYETVIDLEENKFNTSEELKLVQFYVEVREKRRPGRDIYVEIDARYAD